MKGNFSRKLICGALAGVMMFSLVGCGDNTTTTNPTNPDSSVVAETEGNDTVVAVVNGKNITRGEIGEELIAAEKDVISGYIYDMLLQEFFKDVQITDSEVDLQMSMIKSQVGEESWPMYLAYYGGGSETAFKEILKGSLRQESYIKEKMEDITIEKSVIEEQYNADPNAHNIAVLDVVFLNSVDDLKKAKDLYAQGKSLEDISKEFDSEIFKDEHTYFYSEGLTWSADFAKSKVGDYIFSGEDSGSLVIGRIVELNTGVDNAKVNEDLVNSLKYDEAYNMVNKEYENFLKEQKAQIFGEDFALFEEAPASETNVG